MVRDNMRATCTQKQTVIACPVVDDVPGLSALPADVFGATSHADAPAEVRIGDSILRLHEGTARPMAFHIYVPDTDATYTRALQGGFESLQAPVDEDWGERRANVKDPWGNCWYIATFKGGNYFSDGAPTIQPFLQPVDAAAVIAFPDRAFGATERGRATSPEGTLLHATLKIGSPSIELIDAIGIYQPMPGICYLSVAHREAVYAQAISAGAELVSGPDCLPHTVRDPFGNIWHLEESMPGNSAVN